MGISEYRATGGDRVLLNNYHRKLDSSANFQLNFLPVSKQVYGFDYLGSDNHGIFSTNEFYPKSGSYDFRYKSIETTKTDYVKVDFSNYNGIKDSVVFKDRYGIKLKLSKDNILTFTGTQKPDTNYIYAYDNSGQRIGKLFVYTYKRQTKNVVLVSVNGAKIDKTITADGLNKIFNPAVTEFIISEDKIEIPDLETFTHGGSNWHSVYNSDQKLVLETYDKNIKDDNFYLFFVDNVLDKKDSLGTSVSGYMPRGYNCGFIYEGGSLHTVAHELGHGVGNLEHAFSASNSSGKTQNLMDYSTGEELYHFQWNEIQDPSRVWMKWSKDEGEGENVATSEMLCINDEKAINEINKYHNFFLPSSDKENLKIINLENTKYQASGFITIDKTQNLSDEIDLTEGTLAGLRYFGGDYILNYQSDDLSLKSFKYFDKINNQQYTLVKVDELEKSNSKEDAVKVYIDKKTNKIYIKNYDFQLVETINVEGDFTCLQPQAVNLTKHYFKFDDGSRYSNIKTTSNDISENQTIVDKLVEKILDSNLPKIENKLSEELQKVLNFTYLNNLIVQFIDIESKLYYNQEGWQNLAQKVAKELSKKGNYNIDNKIIITIPYTKILNNNTEQYYYMPGFYLGDDIYLRNEIGTDYNNLSSKELFTENDAEESLIQFIKKVSNCSIINQLTSDPPNLEGMAEMLKTKLVELNKNSKLRKPMIHIWIDTDEYKGNVVLLQNYIKEAFYNCVDFSLGYDLDFVDKCSCCDENNIYVGITLAQNLTKYCTSCEDKDYQLNNIVSTTANGNKGVTPNWNECPIWIDFDISNYPFMTICIMHEIGHRLTNLGAYKLGGRSRIVYHNGENPFNEYFTDLKEGHHDSDKNSLMAYGASSTNKDLCYNINEKINKDNMKIKLYWNYDIKRKYVILYQLLIG